MSAFSNLYPNANFTLTAADQAVQIERLSPLC